MYKHTLSSGLVLSHIIGRVWRLSEGDLLFEWLYEDNFTGKIPDEPTLETPKMVMQTRKGVHIAYEPVGGLSENPVLISA